MITVTVENGYNERYAPSGAKKAYLARITGRDTKMTFAREFLGGGDVMIDMPGLYEHRETDKKGNPDDSYFVCVFTDGATGDGNLVQLSCEKEDAMKIAKAMQDGRDFDSVVGYCPPQKANEFGKAQQMAAFHAAQIRSDAGKSRDDRVKVNPTGSIAHLAEADGTCLRGTALDFRASEVARLNVEISERESRGETSILDATEEWEFLTAKQAEKAAAGQTVDSAIAACWAAMCNLPEKQQKAVMSALRAKVSPKSDSVASPVESMQLAIA